MIIYVSNLPYDTTQFELKVYFGSCGEVTEVILCSDRITGRPRGFGFVTFRDVSAAERAIQEYDGREFGGRRLRVDRAREREPRQSRMR
jgi:RNA recognition motif-containing protein